MIFVTSDTHWGHRLLSTMRGFDHTEEHDHWLHEVWNAVVGPDDTIYHLGDVSFLSPQLTTAYARTLRGKVVLVPGNHDRRKTKNALRDAGWRVLGHLPFEDPQLTQFKTWPVAQVTVASRAVVLCHYPLASWPGMHRGAVHLHGHCHGNLGDERTTRTDVGVDGIWGPGPVCLEEVVARLSKRRMRKVDHHVERT